MKDTQMVPANENQAIVSSLNNAGNELYSSFGVESVEDRMKLYNATSSEGVTLKSMVNKTIELVDVVVMPVEVKNDDGSTSIVPRTTLIDKNGKLVTATSWGVYNCVKKIAAIFGGLHFETPLKVEPFEVKTKGGFTLNLKIV